MPTATALILAGSLVAGGAVAGTEPGPVSIGVLAYRGDEQALARWGPTAVYLSEALPDHRFVIKPLDLNGMQTATARSALDFILTNPGHYVTLESEYQCTRLVTLKNLRAGNAYKEYGAVIFTRADRADIHELVHLRGKSFMAVSQDAFGGFQMAWSELQRHDLDPFRDFAQISFAGFPQDQIVYSVRNGIVDAGTVRTDTLERMAAEGKINGTEFRILNPQHTPGFPFAHSTRLYPEWPFAKARHTPDELAQQVAVALLTMPPDHVAARSGHYAGWTVPLDYQPVHELLKALRLGPYRKPDTITLRDVVHHYGPWLLAAVATLLLMAYVTMHVLELYRRLKHSKLSLENEMQERKRAEHAIRQSETALRALHAITSAQHLGFPDKVRALLNLGCEWFNMPLGVLASTLGERHTIESSVARGDTVCPEAARSLADSYCQETCASAAPVSIEYASGIARPHPPCDGPAKLESYLGIRVVVGGDVYGTLGFAGHSARQLPFSETDKEIIKLMGQWVGSEIQRERAEAEMQKLSHALEQSADTVIVTDRRGVIEYVNPAFQHVTGFDRHEALGCTPAIIRSGQHEPTFYRSLWKTILRGDVFRALFINRRKDGTLFYEEKTITPLTDAQGNTTHFIATGKDVTERKLAEERARQHQAELAHVSRVTTMGEMASGIAHELNQPLSAISNYAHGCVRRLQSRGCDSEELATALDQITSQSERAAQIIRRLRNFVRKGDLRRTPADINDIVREAIEFLAHETQRKSVKLQLKLTAGLPPVLADVIQIEQVVVNLLRNAIEAMETPGWSRRKLVVHTWQDVNDRVSVAVWDTGPGMVEDDCRRIFDAFYSTKADGMGMGLSISRSIIEAHGDHLSAHRNREGGMTFRFSLPTAGK